MAKDLFGTMMGRALQRQAPQGHMTAFITQGEADVLRSLGGGVSPNGGQIMRNGIPSFQTWSGRNDLVLDYAIDPQVQEAADRIEPTQAVSLAEQLARETEQQLEAERNQRDLDAEEDAEADRLLAESNRTQSNIAGDFLPQGSPISQYEIQPLLQQLNAGRNIGGSLPPASFIGAESQFTNEAPLNVRNVPLPVKTRPFGDYISEGQNIVPQERGNFFTNAWDKLQNLGFDNPILEGISTVVSPFKWGTALGKALIDREPLTEGQRLATREWKRLKDPDDIEDARAEYKKQFGREPSVEDIDPTLQQQAQRHGGRTPWEIEQEAQQEEQEAAMLADAIANAPPVSGDPDYPDEAPPLLTPEEDARRGRVRQNINEMPEAYRDRLGLKFTGISPPWTGAGPRIHETPALTPAPSGFQEPATFISPGAYPDVFVNDMTGERFEAPSLGYVPPPGWRRV